MMKCYRQRLLTLCTGALILASFVFTASECKTVSSTTRVSQRAKQIPEKSENVFVSIAKSLASHAVSEFQERARRDPRLGFNITMPLFLKPDMNTNTSSGNNSGLPDFGNLVGASAELGLVGVKGGILGLKAAIKQTIVLVLFVIFLLTGIAYFACNIGVVSCSNLGGGLSNLGGGGSWGQLGSGINPFSRNGYDYNQNVYRTTSNVYNAIDDTQKKYT